MCIFHWGVVTGIKEFSSFLIFVVTLFLKGVDIFDKAVAGCGVLDSLEDIWSILKCLVFGYKVGGCNSVEIPQEVSHEVLLKYVSKSGLKWNHREEFTEECIGGLDI